MCKYNFLTSISLQFFFLLTLFIGYFVFYDNDFWRMSEYFSYETLLYGCAGVAFLSLILSISGFYVLKDNALGIWKYIIVVLSIFLSVLMLYVGIGSWSTS